MNIGAYVRVSGRAQDLGMQRLAIERAATARGDVVTEWRSEKRSGKVLARHELDQLRAGVRAGFIRRLYVYRLDRLTRSGIADTLQVAEELRGYGCQLVSVPDGFDLQGPAAEIILAVASWAAKIERLAINERISLNERISAARDRIEAEGGKWGRPSRMTEADRLKAESMRAGGRTVREIAVAMKVPKSTIARALKAAA
jgi:DNA invertase Pin-like site-specific DNA recombinase